jgi:hypothetical protein
MNVAPLAGVARERSMSPLDPVQGAGTVPYDGVAMIPSSESGQ